MSLQLPGVWLLMVHSCVPVHCPSLKGAASSKLMAPQQVPSTANDRLKWRQKSLLTLLWPQFGTTPRGHRAPELPVGVAEAFAATALRVHFSLCRTCFPHILTDVVPKCTLETSCMQISFSGSVSREPNRRQIADRLWLVLLLGSVKYLFHFKHFSTCYFI